MAAINCLVLILAVFDCMTTTLGVRFNEAWSTTNLEALRSRDNDAWSVEKNVDTALLQEENASKPPGPYGCGPGDSGYDRMLAKAIASRKLQVDNAQIDASTVLIIVDTQLGFTANHYEGQHGGFSQLCLVGNHHNHEQHISRIVQEIEMVKQAGGLIVATKDYHPADHCSFWREAFQEQPCQNRAEAANRYATANKLPPYIRNRYQNAFPVHCVGTANGVTQKGKVAFMGTEANPAFDDSHPVTKQPARETETDLHANVWQAMQGYKRSFMAYKGFDRRYESFGAFPMKGEDRRASALVGAKVWTRSPSVLQNNKNPTAAEFTAYGRNPSQDKNFVAIEDFLKLQRIRSVRVVGYVYDFCVKETAIGAVQQGFKHTTVIMDATRPAADGFKTDQMGEPGLPGVPDSGANDRTLGSIAASEYAFKQLQANGVRQVLQRTTAIGTRMRTGVNDVARAAMATNKAARRFIDNARRGGRQPVGGLRAQ